jgi:hypothetical protein
MYGRGTGTGTHPVPFVFCHVFESVFFFKFYKFTRTCPVFTELPEPNNSVLSFPSTGTGTYIDSKVILLFLPYMFCWNVPVLPIVSVMDLDPQGFEIFCRIGIRNSRDLLVILILTCNTCSFVLHGLIFGLSENLLASCHPCFASLSNLLCNPRDDL